MGCKFFNKNKLNSSQTYSFTSADTDLAKYLYDDDFSTQLTSSGSDDLTPEILTITFGTTVTADAIFVGNHNIKAGNIQYSDDNQSSWKDFSAAIAWSANSNTYDYFPFTQVSGITDLRLTANTTITADAEKVIGQLRLLEEFGEMSRGISYLKYFERKAKTSNISQKGRKVLTILGKYREMLIGWNKLPSTDMDLLTNFDDAFEEKYVYPCGGTLTYNEKGWRKQDMYLMNIESDLEPEIQGMKLGLGENIMVRFSEA